MNLGSDIKEEEEGARIARMKRVLLLNHGH